MDEQQLLDLLRNNEQALHANLLKVEDAKKIQAALWEFLDENLPPGSILELRYKKLRNDPKFRSWWHDKNGYCLASPWEDMFEPFYRIFGDYLEKKAPTERKIHNGGFLLESRSQGEDCDSQLSVLEGRYEIIEYIAEGGMGIVYKARNISLDKIVAIKQIKNVWVDDKDFRKRFEREIRGNKKLNHPNIISVIDRNHEPLPVYYVMEFAENGDLQKKISHEEMTLEAIGTIFLEVCQGLQYAHKKGIIHRDLKPQNILFDESDTAKLSDFGLCLFEGRDTTTLTASGVGLGTPAYMAPEQKTDAKDVDNRADIYSLGIILYEMLTGTWDTRLGDPSTKREDITSEIDAFVFKMAAHDPDDRFQTVDEIIEQVRFLFSVEEIDRTSSDHSGHIASIASPRLKKAIIGTIIAVLIVSSVFLYLKSPRGSGLLNAPPIPLNRESTFLSEQAFMELGVVESHGELEVLEDYFGMLEMYLEGLCNVSPIFVDIDDDVIQSYDVLFISNPTQRLRKQELSLLDEFIERGGRLVLFCDSSSPGTLDLARHFSLCPESQKIPVDSHDDKGTNLHVWDRINVTRGNIRGDLTRITVASDDDLKGSSELFVNVGEVVVRNWLAWCFCERLDDRLGRIRLFLLSSPHAVLVHNQKYSSNDVMVGSGDSYPYMFLQERGQGIVTIFAGSFIFTNSGIKKQTIISLPRTSWEC